MKAEQMLYRLRQLIMLIEDRREELQKYIDNATKVTAGTEGTGSSGTISDKVGNNVIKYVDEERRRGIDKLEAEKNEIIRMLEKLPMADYEILYALNVKGITEKKYALRKGKTEQWAYRKKKKAIAALQDLIERNEK